MPVRYHRALPACAAACGWLVWVLPGIWPGTASAADMASGQTTGSQCQPLPTAVTTPSASASPTASAPPVDLCVSVKASQSSVNPGKPASYTVTVWTQNGSASGVSVTLAAAPATAQPAFSGMCPSGDGSASCTIGSLATDVSPSSFQMQAQVAIAAGTAAGTAATLTAIANATTSPPMTTLPTAAASVTVNPAAAPSHSPSPSKTTAPSSAPPSALPALPVTGVMPTVAAVPTPQGAITALVSPGSITSLLPVITPSAAPSGVASPAADVQSGPGGKNGEAGSFTLVMPAATAEILGSVVLALVITLAVTRLLATSRLTTRASPGAANRTGRGTAKGAKGTKGTTSLIRRLRRPLARKTKGT